MDDIAINVDNVSKSFKLPHERSNSIKSIFVDPFKSTMHKNTVNQQALKNVSFSIKKGEFFGIVGRNGSGKSTLLKMLAGIYQPNKGSVSISGKLVPFIELGVGFNPELTGRENVYLNGALLGFSRKEIDAQYDEIVAFAELEKFMDQKLKNYSSGMQVRLAFSVATKAKADVLLVDEVLAVGDADFQRKCFDYFKELKGSDTTIIFVSHNMNAVREYCDRALLINDSKVVKISDSDTIAKMYSKMFVDEAINRDSFRAGNERWGNGEVKYTKLEQSTQVLSAQKEIVITATAKSKAVVEDLIVGFSIKNAAKQIILGSNNQLKSQRIKKLEKGEVFTVKWTIPNIFVDGKYTMDITAVLSNGQECDWWEDAVTFRAASPEEHAAYIVSPPIDLKITY